MNINPSRGSDAPLGFNASNQSLINTLLQQASKSSEKKRPTFEEVFAKLNARSARMDANKNPINNMLTNEQLFRYYIKETEPKLQISNEIFSGEELFNPMKESDPTKSYGTATTLTSDIAQLSDPANNLPNPIIPEPITAPAPRAPRQNIPRVPRKIPNLSLEVPIFATIAPAEAGDEQLPDRGLTPLSVPLPIGDDATIIDFNLAEQDLQIATNIIDRMDNSALWANTSQETRTIFSILFNNDDFFTRESTEYMKGLISAGTLDKALEGINDVFKQTRGNQAVNNFITNRIAMMMGIDTNAGIGAVEKFNKLFNPNRIGEGEGKISIDEFKMNVLNYLNSQGSLKGNEKLRVDKTIIEIEDRGLKDNIGKYYNEVRDRYDALRIKYDAVLQPQVLASALMGDLFSDTATSAETNTDINSLSIDPQIVNVLNKPDSSLSYSFLKPPTSIYDISVPSEEAGARAEAGSGEVDVDNVVRRRGERGPDKEPRSRRTNRQIQEELMVAKGGK
jgi:hypothetical protein